MAEPIADALGRAAEGADTARSETDGEGRRHLDDGQVPRPGAEGGSGGTWTVPAAIAAETAEHARQARDDRSPKLDERSLEVWTAVPSGTPVPVYDESEAPDFDWGTPDPFMPGPCPHWCAFPDDHRATTFDEDRKHLTASAVVHCRHLPMWSEPGSQTYSAGSVTSYLEQHVQQREPILHVMLTRLAHDGKPPIWDLTLDEAETIAKVWLRMVEAAR